jgi:hypothetical protein
MAKLELPKAAASLVPQNEPRDAGDLYRQAIRIYNENRSQYNKFARSTNAADAESLKALQLIIEATPYSKATLLSSNLQEAVSYDSDHPRLDALTELVALGARAGSLYKAEKNYKQAMKYFDAIYALGWKLYQERMNLPETDVALNAMGTGAAGIQSAADAADDTARAQAAADFIEAKGTWYENTYLPIKTAVTAIDPGLIAKYFGDVAAIAQDSNDRMWRTEATLALGRYRYNASRSGDQRGARRVLKKLKRDPDPLVAHAAQEALDLTLQQYRALH